ISQGVPGLTFSTHKKPIWRTDVAPSINGRDVRTARMKWPKYGFELKFDFLDDRNGEGQMNTLMGFFNSQRGKWGNWLYQDPTDYLLTGQRIGVGDGGTTGFRVLKTRGGFTDPVNQVDF